MNKIAKVPVVMQQEMVECGAASLAMVLAYHGLWLPLEQVRSDCGVSRDGSSAKNIALCGMAYGMEVQGYRCEPEGLHTVEYPCIIHWNFNHFVVLCGFTRKYAIINDPARGHIKVTLTEFDKAFTGVVLTFSPTDTFVRGGKPPSVWGFAKERLRGTGTAFAFVIVTGIITSIFGIVTPILSRVFVDNLLSGKNPDWLWPFVGIYLFVIGASTIVAALSQRNSLRIMGKFAIVANGVFMWHVLRLPVEFFANRFAGDIAVRQSSNEGISVTLIQQMAPLLLDCAMLIFYLVVMLRYSVLLTCIGLSAAFFNLYMSGVIAKKRINISRSLLRDSGKLSAVTTSGIEMIETIKASGAEEGFFQRWSGYHASVNTSGVLVAKLNGYWGSLPVLFSQLSNVIVLGLGIYLIIDGGFTVGMLLAFQGFLGSFMVPVNSIIGVRQSIEEMRTTMERVQDIMSYKTDVEYTAADAVEYKKLTGVVELNNITFGYSKLSPPLIEDFSLSLKTGSRVALVGGSGCGKSTIAKLVSGLYKPWSGDILFDGRAISDIPREIFTGSVAVVDQDITLFEDSINDNIKMWDSSVMDFEVIMAARDAQVHNMIIGRDGGYSHKISESGKNFSGGERQRIEIARTLAGDPTIVILDEATSALDAKTEHELVNAIKLRGITCIIIAHRLSTIRDCDEIIVLDRGKVVQRGTHTELYAAEGHYRDLVSSE